MRPDDVEKISILQTPLNEEKGKKRDAETTTPISGSSEQPGTKRQRLNPLSEVEFVQETTDSQRREELDSQQTFTISGTSNDRREKSYKDNKVQKYLPSNHQ